MARLNVAKRILKSTRNTFPQGFAGSLTGRLSSPADKSGFTLAEVLITLGVIGIVAALTMPSLMTDVRMRSWSEMHANTAFKVTQALDQMRALGRLDGSYNTTDEFVDELQKYLKIAKRCDANHIEDCWPAKQVVLPDGKIFDIKKAKTGKNLQLKDNTSDNVALVLANGVPIILTYNEKSEPMEDFAIPHAFMKNLPVGRNKTKDFAYSSDSAGVIDFVMDVNGAKPPNKMDTTGSDIRSFRLARLNNALSYIDLGYVSSVDTTTGSPDAIWDTRYQSANNGWAGAKKACASTGMRLPTTNEIEDLLRSMGKAPEQIGAYWYYWTSEEFDGHPAHCPGSRNNAKISFMDGAFCEPKENPRYVMCVSN
ncbi:MAG: type II secretion system GspH family protein [Heliobacteriaceae bacterium]|jgi:prepilin-type N-terminal cleavage/methylation domain-containing protein|nr:type II secretion system GspH family protein [Heliobacteriaceae bacterium]